jgi:hypothetical protein
MVLTTRDATRHTSLSSADRQTTGRFQIGTLPHMPLGAAVASRDPHPTNVTIKYRTGLSSRTPDAKLAHLEGGPQSQMRPQIGNLLALLCVTRLAIRGADISAFQRSQLFTLWSG